MNEIGPLLKRARERAGLSKSALARAAGVDRELITRWEEGKTVNMSLPILVALMDECGVDVTINFKEREEHNL